LAAGIQLSKSEPYRLQRIKYSRMPLFILVHRILSILIAVRYVTRTGVNSFS